MDYSLSLQEANSAIQAIISKSIAILYFKKIDELVPPYNCTLVQNTCTLVALCKNILHDNGKDNLLGIASNEPVILFSGPKHT